MFDRLGKNSEKPSGGGIRPPTPCTSEGGVIFCKIRTLARHNAKLNNLVNRGLFSCPAKFSSAPV